MRPKFSDLRKLAEINGFVGNFFGADFQKHFQNLGHKSRKHDKQGTFSVLFAIIRCKLSVTKEPAPKR